MKERHFKFKNNKHSVIMKLISSDGKGRATLQAVDYPIQYEVDMKDIEEIKHE